MAQTVLPADRIKAACERSANRRMVIGDTNTQGLLPLLHLASAALSVSPDATLTISSEEFMMLAESWT